MRHHLTYILVCISLSVIPALAQSGRTLVNEGNKLYEEKKYDEALSNYKEAMGKRVPEDIVRYDLGNVYYRKDNFDLAEKELESAITSDNPDMQARGYFNRGNARYKQQQFDKSIADYIEVLKRNPDDIGAKVNLELARRMLQLQQQQQSQQDSSQQNQQQSKQDSTQQNQQQQQSKPDSTQQNQQQQQEQEQKQQEEQQAQASEQKGELSQKEAEKLLNALQNDEKDVLREMLQRQIPETQPRGKDW